MTRVVNQKMVRQILNLINKQPETFDMSNWVGNFDWDDIEVYNPETGDWDVPADAATSLTISLEFDSQDQPKQDINICGTTFCVAGWAVALDGWTFKRDNPESPIKEGQEFTDWVTEGQRILGLSEYDADRLFGVRNYVAKRALTQLSEGAQDIDWADAENYS